MRRGKVSFVERKNLTTDNTDYTDRKGESQRGDTGHGEKQISR